MSLRDVIDRFLAGHRIAFVGVSKNPQDFSRALFRELVARGYEVVPIRPGVDEIEGRAAYARVQDVPGALDGALLLTTPKVSEQVVRDCHEAGVPRVWLHRAAGPGAVSDEAVRFCAEHGIEAVPGECPFMFFGGSVHAFHRGMRRLAGGFPLCAPEQARAARATGRLLAGLVALELFVAVGAFVGGVSMVATPQGTPMGFPQPENFPGLPFASYLVPGILLIVANGLLPLTAAVGGILRKPWAGRLHALVGLVLSGWIVAQVAFVGLIHPLQVVLLAIGLAQLVGGVVYRSRSIPRAPRVLHLAPGA